MRTKFEGVAIATTEENGRYLTRNVIPMRSEHAMAVATALQGIDNLSATPVRRDFDVFGRVFWTNREER